MMCRWLAGLILLAGLAALPGCRNPLYPKNLPHSPYERYMVLRGQYRPVYADVNDARRDDPRLRERLSPLRGAYER